MEILHEADKEPVLRVLYVEHDPHDAELVATSFEYGNGHLRVVRVESGREAMDDLCRNPPFEQERRPHLVMTAMNLPDRGGLDLLCELKGEDGLVGLPVVVLAGSGDPVLVEEAHRLGASVYASKLKDLARLGQVAASSTPSF